LGDTCRVHCLQFAMLVDPYPDIKTAERTSLT
jgi:hypothetical protein